MADVSEGKQLKKEIDTLLESVANMDKSMSGGKKKRKTKTKSKGKKVQDGGRKKRTKSKSGTKGRKVQDGGKKKRTKSKSKGRKHEDELTQLGGKKKRSKSKSGSKGRKQGRAPNPYFEALQKLRVYIVKDGNLKEGLGIPITVLLNKLLKEGDKDYNKALEIYKKDREGFKKDLEKEIVKRSKK